MPRTSAKPPATQTEPVTETLHGVEIVDNYRWLEGDNSNPADQGKVTPDVAAWTDAQNALHARRCSTLCRAARRSKHRLRPLMEVGSVSAPACAANRYFFTKREGSQNQPVVYWREGVPGARPRADRSGRARCVRPDDGRVVFAVA